MKVENYITELEITALELNDYRTSAQNDGIDRKKQHYKNNPAQRKTDSKGGHFLHTILHQLSKILQGDIYHGGGKDVISTPTIATKERNTMQHQGRLRFK